MKASTIGLVIVAIVGLAGALAVLYTRSETTRRIVNEVFADIKLVVGAVVNFLSAAWRRYGDDLINVARTAFGAVRDFVRAVLNVVLDIVRLFGDLFHGRWDKLWGDIEKLAKDYLRAVVAFFRGQIEVFLSIAKAIGGAIRDGLQAAWDQIKSAAYKAVLAIVEPFSHLPGAMGAWARRAKEAVKSELEAMKEPAINAAVVTAQAWGRNFYATATPFVQALVGQTSTALGNISKATSFGPAAKGDGSGVVFSGVTTAGINKAFLANVAAARSTCTRSSAAGRSRSARR
jgi:phage-related protein